MNRPLTLALALAMASGATAEAQESTATVTPQKHFKKQVAAGNYSGIAPLGNGFYAVVDDKSAEAGFYRMKIDVDPAGGAITNVADSGFVSFNHANRDIEAIARNSATTVVVAYEDGNTIAEYTIGGKATGRQAAMPAVFNTARPNAGLESLTADTAAGTLWTTSESTLRADGALPLPGSPEGCLLRLQPFDSTFCASECLFYRTDPPRARRKGRSHAIGVSALCALGNGEIAVLEREFYVARLGIGSFVANAVYIVKPSECAGDKPLAKRLLARFTTRFNLLRRDIANYEGMCPGPTLPDGRRTLILVSDSQGRHKGIMKDRFRTVVFR